MSNVNDHNETTFSMYSRASTLLTKQQRLRGTLRRGLVIDRNATSVLPHGRFAVRFRLSTITTRRLAIRIATSENIFQMRLFQCTTDFIFNNYRDVPRSAKSDCRVRALCQVF